MSWLPEIRYIFPFSLFSTFTHSAEPPRQKSPRWNTISSGPTTRFQLTIIVSFMCDTSLKGLLQNLMILVWLKWVSDVKNTLLPSNLYFIIFSFMRITARFIIRFNSARGGIDGESASCERHQQASNKNRRKVWYGLSDGFHLSFQRDTSIIVSQMVYQTFVGICLQKYRMLQCPKYGHTTISQGILCLDPIWCSSCSFFFAAL